MIILWFTWAAVLVAALILHLRNSFSRFKDHGVKNPRVLPFLGNMLKVVLRIDDFATDMHKYYFDYPEERFVGRYEFLRPVIVVNDLDLVKKITIKDFEHFLDHRGFTDESVEPLFSRNLFSLKGQEWKDMRSTLSPAFTSSKIKLMVPFMEEVGEQMIPVLKKKIKESPTGSIDIDCKDLTSRYGNDVIASCAFGLKMDSLTDENNEFYERGKVAATFKLRQQILFFIMSACPAIARKFKLTIFSNDSKNFFVDLVSKTMKERDARNIVRPDMIHLLMEAKKGRLSHDDKSSENGNSGRDAGFATVEESTIGKKNVERVWSDMDLFAQATLFFIAGFDTISTGTSFALHELALNPEAQERLHQEIKEYDLKHGGKLTYAGIQDMTYMDMVVSEVLRMWTPGIAQDRICTKDYNLGKPNDKATEDYIIRKGEAVWIPTWCFHRDPKYFPNPDKFDPERFSDENKHLINSAAYMPFGVGPRNCIGSRFALCEIKVLLYQILLHFEVSPSVKTRLPSRLSTESFNPRLAGGHWLTFKARTMIFLIWSFVIILLLTLYVRKTYSRFSDHGVKNPKTFPLFGNMSRVFWGVDTFAADLDMYYNNFADEKFVGKYEFMRPVLFVKDLDLIKRIAIKDFEHFLDHREFSDEKVDPLFSRNLLSLRGQEWKDMRSTLSPAFTSSKIKLMVPFMEEVGEQMLRALKSKFSLSTTGSIDIDCKDLTSRFANDVIASCAFSLKVDSLTDEKNKFHEKVQEASGVHLRQILMFFIMSTCPSIAKKLKLTIHSNETQDFFVDLVLNTMKERERLQIIRPDMIHLLMEARKGKLTHDAKHSVETSNQDTGFATAEESTLGKKNVDRVWSDMDLVAQATLFFTAGFDTVSTAMSFALHELALHPDIQERLYKEIKEIDVKHGGRIDFTSIQNMTYLDMVVSEVLRIWPPALALDRVCVKDYNMGKPNDQSTQDYIIRKGEALWIPTWCFHRDPKYFPDPEKFDPERFSNENKHRINSTAYMPFGLGPRNCIGSRFALCEIKVLLYQLLLHIEVSPSVKTQLPSRLSVESFSPRLLGGHWLTFKSRN